MNDPVTRRCSSRDQSQAEEVKEESSGWKVPSTTKHNLSFFNRCRKFLNGACNTVALENHASSDCSWLVCASGGCDIINLSPTSSTTHYCNWCEFGMCTCHRWWKLRDDFLSKNTADCYLVPVSNVTPSWNNIDVLRHEADLDKLMILRRRRSTVETLDRNYIHVLMSLSLGIILGQL